MTGGRAPAVSATSIVVPSTFVGVAVGDGGLRRSGDEYGRGRVVNQSSDDTPSR
jgi:hypothetical protein